MILILFFISAYLSKILPFTQQTFESIFKLQSKYIVYVHSNTNSKIHQDFNNFCHDKIICRELSSVNSELYNQISSFLNYKQNQYFFIIDASNYKKYILKVQDSSNYDRLTQFYQDFINNILQPYYSSQQKPLIINQKCKQLTGKTYQQFLFDNHPIKIVYLYTKDQNCLHCQNILKQFMKFGQKYYDQNLIGFGFFDIVFNDSKYIKDQIMPYFLIYVNDIDEPMGYQPEDLNQFQQMIRYLISQQKQLRQKIKRKNYKNYELSQ